MQSSASLFVGCIYCPPSTSLADINRFTACLEDSIENQETETQELGQDEEKEKLKAKKHRRGTEMSSANRVVGESDEEEGTSKHCGEDELWLEARS